MAERPEHDHAHADGHRHGHDEHGHAEHDEHGHEAHAHEAHADDAHGHDEHKHDAHDHSHDHAHDLRATPLRRLIAALVMTAGFMFVEAGVGFWAHSLALVADAGHMLADAAALGMAIFAQQLAPQARTRSRTYGHRRAEVLAAYTNGVVLAVTAILIFVEAARRWREPPEIMGKELLVTAVVGLVVNLVAAVMLGLGQHGHNINTRGALAHVLTDALGSVGAIAAGVLVITLGWNRADTVISVLIGVLVLWGGYRLMLETSQVLMEGSPIEVDIAHIEETLRSVPGVDGFHDLHVWSISEGFDVLTVHVVLTRGFHGTEVVSAVSRRLREEHGLGHCTIQPEPSQGEQLVKLGRRPAQPE